ncbi:MAG TPA: hypothetical protein VFA22_07190 [Stellaceae bacterium]|nr:hypothetical protein [Stellaceae bacterium]
MRKVKPAPAPAEPPLGQRVDGGFFISDEQLQRLCPGDPKQARRRLRLLLADERERAPVVGPTAYPNGVRLAQPEEADALTRLFVEDMQENAAHVAPLSPPRIAEIVNHCVTRVDGALCPVIDGVDGPAAAMLLAPQRWMWSEAFYLQEFATYVSPLARGGPHIVDLIHFAEWAADEWTRTFGYRVYVLLSVLNSIKTAPKVRLYKRYITPAGAYFIYPWPGDPGAPAAEG